VDALVVEQVKDFTRQTDELPCYLVDAGSNRTQIFFPSGLPDWAEVGQSITLDGTGHGVFDGDTFEIVEINAGTLLAEGFPVMIIAATFPTTGTIGGTLTAEYDIEPFDVWEFEINWGDYEAGKYYMILEGEDPQFDPFTAESEPIELAADHPDTILFRHRNTENAKQIFYDTGIEHVIRMEGELSRPQPGGEEVNHEDSQYRFIKLQENVTRNPMLHVADVTPYLAEKLSLICSQDYVEINGAEYGKQDEKVEVEYFDTEALCNARIKLRQVDFVAENSDDTGDVDNPTLLNVNGVLLSVDPELP
jgi:hypothetical protein